MGTGGSSLEPRRFVRVPTISVLSKNKKYIKITSVIFNYIFTTILNKKKNNATIGHREISSSRVKR